MPPQIQSLRPGAAEVSIGRSSATINRPAPWEIVTTAIVLARREARPPRKSAAPYVNAAVRERTRNTVSGVRAGDDVSAVLIGPENGQRIKTARAAGREVAGGGDHQQNGRGAGAGCRGVRAGSGGEPPRGRK